MSLLKRHPVCHARDRYQRWQAKHGFLTVAAREACLTDAGEVEVDIPTGGCPSRVAFHPLSSPIDDAYSKRRFVFPLQT